MGLLTELYKTYNKSLEGGLVDKQETGKAILLPLYHNNMRSNGNNIIQIDLNKNGNLQAADFLPKDEVIIFPVNEHSVARSGRNPPAHPLVDKIDYISTIDHEKNELFVDAFHDWYTFLPEGPNKEFLTIIKTFISQENMLEQIISHMFKDYKYTLNEFNLEYEETINDKTRIRKIDLSKVFLTYSINQFDGLQNISVTANLPLHQSYIQYVNSHLMPNGFCNISGTETYISSKHRGLLGNAKLVSVSNNTETYLGRFKKKSDVFQLGYETSEKIHLMLKYLLENDQSNQWLGGQQYLINWISTENEIEFADSSDIMSSLFQASEKQQKSYQPTTGQTGGVGPAILSGNLSSFKEANFYAAIIDKSSNGRISVKYFRKIPASQLLENLEKWRINNSWEFYHFKTKESKNRPPHINEAIRQTFGLERNGQLIIDKANFQKDLFQKLVVAMIDGQMIPRNFLLKLDTNIRNRLSYPKSWNTVVSVACGFLNNEREGSFNMTVDKKNTNRSYLFGRLLALYEIIEARTFKQNEQRVTNAEKFWSSYTNHPENIMQVLEEKIKPYEKRLNISNPGLNIKIQKEKSEILTLLDQHTTEAEANKRLSYQFIYGYYSEKKFIYTTQEENKEND